MKFDDGMTLERELFIDADADARESRRCATPSSPSARRRKIPDVPADTPPRAIKHGRP